MSEFFASALGMFVFVSVGVIGFTVLRLYSDKREYNRAGLVKQGVKDTVVFGLMYLAITNPNAVRQFTEIVASVPLVVYGVIVSVVGLVDGASTYLDRVPNLPRPLFFAHLSATILVVTVWVVGQEWWFKFHGIEAVVAGFVGLLVWFGLSILGGVITVSILQIDPREEYREGDGEYGDEHLVNGILSEDEMES